MLLGLRQVAGHHFSAHFLHRDFRHPAQFLFGFGGVAQQGFHFGGAEVAWVNLHDHIAHLQGWGIVARNAFNHGVLFHALTVKTQGHTHLLGRPLNELAHAVLHSGGNHEVFSVVLLQHHPLHAHIVFGVAPVAQGVHVAHVQAVFQAQGNVGQAPGDLAGDEGFAPAWAFVVEQHAVAGIHAVGLAVVHGDPVGVQLGHGVGAAGVKRRGFFLRNFLHQAIKFAGARLVKAGFLLQAQNANGFQNAQRAYAVHIGGVFRAFKAHGHMAHGAQVVNFVGLGFLNDSNQVAGVAQVAVMQFEARVVNVRVLVDVVYALGVEQAAPAFDAVHDVTLFQQKLGEVRAVLAGDACDEGDFGLVAGFWGAGVLGHGFLAVWLLGLAGGEGNVFTATESD